jgi:hypothetical protein
MEFGETFAASMRIASSPAKIAALASECEEDTVFSHELSMKGVAGPLLDLANLLFPGKR